MSAAQANVQEIWGAVLNHSGCSRPYAKSRPLSVVQLELEEPAASEVLVEIEAAGICHSDLSVIDGNRPRPLPMLLGHEAAGRVVSLGEAVDDISLGQRVVLVFMPRCEECLGCKTGGRLPCEAGAQANAAGELLSGGKRLYRNGSPVGHHLGVSAFATHATVSRRSVVPVPDDIPPHIAALLGCAVLTGGGSLINAAKPLDGDDVIVVGLGGVGMSALLTALALKRGRVIGVDASQEKLRTAQSFGADAVFTPEAARAGGIKAPIVIEAAGHAKAFETAFDLTSPGGTTVTVSLPAPDAASSLRPLIVTTEARTIIGSYLGSAIPGRDIPFYAQLWREGRLPIDRLISATIGLDQINQAMDELAEGRALRQIVVPRNYSPREGFG